MTAAPSRLDSVTVRLERDTVGWWTAAVLVALLGGPLLLAGLAAAPDDRASGLVFVGLGVAVLLLVRGPLRVVRTRPELAFDRRRVTLHDPGLLRAPLSFRLARVEAVYVGPFDTRAGRPPWSGARGWTARRTFVRMSDRWAVDHAGPVVRPWVAVPDLSTSLNDRSPNLLVLLARPLGVRRHPRRGLGWVNVMTRSATPWSGPFTGTYVRALLGRVADPAAVAGQLAPLVPVGERPPPEVCERLEVERPTFADVWAWMRRRPPPPARP